MLAALGMLAGVLVTAAPASADVNYPSGCQTWSVVNPSPQQHPFLWSYNCWLGYDYWRRGNYVTGVQRIVRSMGYDPGAIDGLWGPATYGAVYDFQLYNIGGSPPDGIVGQVTWSRLQDHIFFDFDDGSFTYYNIADQIDVFAMNSSGLPKAYWTQSRDGTFFAHFSEDGPA